MYDTRILIRGNLLLPDLPAVVVTAGLRHEDLDDPVAASMVDNHFSPRTHNGSDSSLMCRWEFWLARPGPWVGVIGFLSRGIVYEVRSFIA